MEIFSKRLIQLRQEQGLSQRALAKETGISPSAIKQWENESRVPNAEAIVILARYFGVRSDFLLGLE